MNEENQPNTTTDMAKSGPNSPAEKAGINWEMPAPIFRVSEGVTVSKKPAEPVPEKEAQIVHRPLPDSPPDIKPVPSDAEHPAANNAGPTGAEEVILEPVPAKKPGFSVLGFIMTAAGILGMLIFLIVLLGIIYFYFIYKSEPGGVF